MLSETPKASRKKTKSVPSRLWIVVAVVLLGIGAAWMLQAIQRQGEYSRAVIAEREFRLEVADTQEQRTQGLSGRDGLPKDTAMLFVFPEAGEHCIWMKDMRVPIDIVWLDKDGEVVDVRTNVDPESYPESFCPTEFARYVLEFSAGAVVETEIRHGTRVELRHD